MKKGFKISFISILLLILILIISCDDSDFIFYKKNYNKFFIEKSISLHQIKGFIENYSKSVKKFYTENGFLKDINILDENLYIYILKNTFNDINPKDPVILENTRELQKKFGLFLGYLEDSRFTEDRFVGAFYAPHLNSIFLKSNQLIPLTMDLIVELNHHFIFKNQPIKVKNYQLKVIFGFDIKPENYDIETANYLYFLDDSITNFFSFYNYATGYYNITKEGLYTFKFVLRNYLNSKKFRKEKNLKWVLKFGNYGYGEGLFLYEYSFILFVLDNFGYDTYKEMIKFLYNEEYKTIDNMSKKVFKVSFNELLSKWEEYKEN